MRAVLLAAALQEEAGLGQSAAALTLARLISEVAFPQLKVWMLKSVLRHAKHSGTS
jgi:hypothetical protein